MATGENREGRANREGEREREQQTNRVRDGALEGFGNGLG
jgi:hypothetical protein